MVAIKVGKLIDPEKGVVLTNQIVLVDHDTILAVGADLSIPRNSKIIDLSNATALPGLIDCHTHLTFQAGGNYYDNRFRKTPIDFAIVVHIYARKTLEAGFTTCRDVGSRFFMDVALRNAINRGEIVGPRMLVATFIIGSTGSHADFDGFSPFLDWKYPPEMTGVANGVDEIRKKVRYNIKYGADVIKFAASGGVLTEEENLGLPQYSQEEMDAIVAEASLWGKKTCAHAHGTLAIKMAIKAGVASIEHGSFLDDEAISMLKERGTYLVADIYNDEYIMPEYKKLNYPQKMLDKEKLVTQSQREGFRKAVKAGVKIAFGTDAGVYPHGWNARQFKWMVKYGMTTMQAIQAATTNAADLIGLKNKIGSVSPGKYADLIAVEGNPLDDVSALENVKFVMKAGIVYKNTF
jgi:imidazolonepropionase-like amidohydrolase